MKDGTCSWLVVTLIMALSGSAICRSILPESKVGNVRPITASKADTLIPNWQETPHDINLIGMSISNYGLFGNPGADQNEIPSLEYPINSGFEYLSYGGIYIGGIKGDDTLVSVTNGVGGLVSELNPDFGGAGAIIQRSTLRHSVDYDTNAISEQDIVCTYTDTLVDYSFIGIDSYDNRPHIPLRVAVIQSSYAWSFSYTEDYILVDYQVINLDTIPIDGMTVGVVVSASIHHETTPDAEWFGDLRGFRPAVKAPSGSCREDDSITIAWAADNDGNPGSDGQWLYASPRDVYGLCVLETPCGGTTVNFNWWIGAYDPVLDFGPRLKCNNRDFGHGLGYPRGDRNKYYIMTQPEIDYDQMFTAIPHVNTGFMPPPKPDYAEAISEGYSAWFLVSTPPCTAMPGDTLRFTIAHVMGAGFHVNPLDFQQYFDPYAPYTYYNLLNFDDLEQNARDAYWVFDNPGWDTDGDDNAGRYGWDCLCGGERICFPEGETPPDSLTGCCHKEYFTGDGVPDFRTAAPPSPPIVHTTAEFGKVTLRWNGKESESSVDFLTGGNNFEGYKVYIGEEDRLTDFVLLCTYDRDDYKVYQYNSTLELWEGIATAAPTDSLKSLYGTDFDPSQYNQPSNPFCTSDGKYLYFAPQGWNESNLTNRLKIHKVYPEASPDDAADVTEEGYQRYYEYEYVVDNLQPSKPYYFAVTTVSPGSFHQSLPSMESSPLVNAVRDYPLPSSDAVVEKGLPVIVFPNPYRTDGGYARDGYENRDRTKRAEWAREIHFANLPPVCKIRIYTLAGDLVQEIDHYYPGGGPGSQEETWNVISRNTQSITSGIYIWSVRSDQTEQLGKLVIIK